MGIRGCDQIRGSTLHSLGMRILSRRNVLATTGRIARPLNRFEIDPLLYDLPSELGGKRQKEKRMRAYEAAWARLQHEEPGFAQNAQDRAFERSLVDWLRFHEGMLVGEIIPELYRYMRNNPVAPERALYDHLLVDEYQGLNKAEQALIDLLTGDASLCVVGDDDQSLYSFKHAHPEGIRTFSATHLGASDHQLLECHRCPTRIVEIANSLIAHNQDREPRELVSVPAKAQRRVIGNPIHDALRARGIPSKCYYQENELDNEVAQERLAIFKLFVNRHDRIALRWLLGLGSDDFRRGAYARVRTHCEQTGEVPWDVLSKLTSGELSMPHCGYLVERFHAIQNELRFLEDHDGVQDFVSRWLRAEFVRAGELRLLVAGILPEAETPEDLLSKIVEMVSQPEIPPDVTEVRVMSLHKSKGLRGLPCTLPTAAEWRRTGASAISAALAYWGPRRGTDRQMIEGNSGVWHTTSIRCPSGSRT